MSRPFMCVIKTTNWNICRIKLTVDQKHPNNKSLNMANNYTEKEYKSYLLMIRPPQPIN